MAVEDPEDRRAARLAAIRAQRGTDERARQIADLESRRRIDPPPPSGTVRTRRTTSAPRPRRTSGQTAGTSFFGHPWAEWHQMVDTGTDHLVEHAEAAATTTEGELWSHIGEVLGLRLEDPRLPMPFLLRDITTRQVDDTGLLLTALVVRDDGTPGPAFFRLAAQLDKLPAAQAPREADDTTWTMNDQQEAFWRQQVESLIAWHGEG